MPAEDEPFEFFRGFSEIFVSIGLVILLAGISATAGAVRRLCAADRCCRLITAAIAWWWAGYFTLKRRMNLPSMVLASAFGGGLFLVCGHACWAGRTAAMRMAVVASFADRRRRAMALWYRRFRLPFSMFILRAVRAGRGLHADGLGRRAWAGSSTAVAGASTGCSTCGKARPSRWPRWSSGSRPSWPACGSTLRDPHRLGRHAATAFWLHLLAAPALVNTVALTLYNVGGGAGSRR